MKILKFNIRDFSENELLFFEGFAQSKSKIVKPQTAIAHYKVKEYLSQIFNTPINNIMFTLNEYGKPYYGKEIFFNISHSSDEIIIVFDKEEIGVDIERIKNINPKLLKKIATEKEQAEFDFEKFDINFLKLWTLKEAYFKFIGTGITDLKSISADEIQNKYYTETIIENEYIISIVKGR